MKILLVLPLALAGLSGCAVYPAYGHRGGYIRVAPVVVLQPAPALVRPAYRSGGRYHRDRDGDGVRNRYDDRPDNPWRH